jgi:hypothetical protein
MHFFIIGAFGPMSQNTIFLDIVLALTLDKHVCKATKNFDATSIISRRLAHMLPRR